jgi:hypothetical protein
MAMTLPMRVPVPVVAAHATNIKGADQSLAYYYV